MEEIVVTIPRERPFGTVAGLVLGGVAARHDLTLDVLDDLQIALETLLDRQGDESQVSVVLRVQPRRIEASIGPFGRDGLAELEHESTGDALDMRRLLSAVVDSIEIRDGDDGCWVELAKDYEPGTGAA